MAIVLLIVIGLFFIALTALVFSVLTVAMGKFTTDFEVEGVESWDRATFLAFYWKYTIVAAVFVLVTLPASVVLVNFFAGLILGFAALTFAYKVVFGAGLKQALIMGIVGGFIATFLFFMLLPVVLIPLKLISGNGG